MIGIALATAIEHARTEEITGAVFEYNCWAKDTVYWRVFMIMEFTGWLLRKSDQIKQVINKTLILRCELKVNWNLDSSSFSKRGHFSVLPLEMKLSQLKVYLEEYELWLVQKADFHFRSRFFIQSIGN